MTNRKLVRDLMTVGVLSCSPDTPIATVAQSLLENEMEGVIVLDHAGYAIGVITQDELVRAYAWDNWQNLTAGEIIRDDVPQFPPDIPLTATAQLMLDRGIRIAFMMHNAADIIYPAAVLTYRHFL